MYCSGCGAQNPDIATYCVQCGRVMSGQITGPPPSKPDNYLVWSILATLFCCPIPGVIGIVYAAQVDSRYYARDYDGAQAAAKSAKTWTLVAFGLGLAWLLIYGAMVAFSLVARKPGGS